MRQSSSNRIVIATAGSHKTEGIVETALAADGRVLISTFTLENQRQITDRIAARVGVVPPNITVMGWFAFLLAHGARPYQRVLTGQPGVIGGLNFKGERSRYIKRSNISAYYLDRNHDMYRDGVADFVCRVNTASEGAVISRLERIYDHILIDEVQDLAGYDLDVLDLLLRADLSVLAVGDPRQHTYDTNRSNRNKKYRGPGLVDWVAERSDLCEVEERTENHRCNQAICDLADSIYPEYESSTSTLTVVTGHDGIFEISRSEVVEYFERYEPVVLRYDRRFGTEGLPAMNIGVSKGRTFDRVLIFPTKPMKQFLADGDASRLTAKERMYVAVTRARHSVAFVID